VVVVAVIVVVAAVVVVVAVVIVVVAYYPQVRTQGYTHTRIHSCMYMWCTHSDSACTGLYNKGTSSVCAVRTQHHPHHNTLTYTDVHLMCVHTLHHISQDTSLYFNINIYIYI